MSVGDGMYTLERFCGTREGHEHLNLRIRIRLSIVISEIPFPRLSKHTLHFKNGISTASALALHLSTYHPCHFLDKKSLQVTGKERRKGFGKMKEASYISK